MPNAMFGDSSGQNSLDSNNFDSPLAQAVQHIFPFMPTGLTTRLGHFSNNFLYKISRPVNNFTNAIDPLRHLFKPVQKAEDWVQHKPADTAAIVGMAYGGGSALANGGGSGASSGIGGAEDGDGGGLAIGASGGGSSGTSAASSSPTNYAGMGKALMGMGQNMMQGGQQQRGPDFMPVMQGHGGGPNPAQTMQPFMSTPQIAPRSMPAPASGFGAQRPPYQGFGAPDQPLPPY